MPVTQSIASALAEMFAPLHYGLQSLTRMQTLFARMGFPVDLNLDGLSIEHIQALFPVDDIGDLLLLVDDLDSAGNAGETVEAIVTLASTLFDLLDSLSTQTGPMASLPEPIDDPAFWQAVAAELPHFLPATYLKSRHAGLYQFLVLTGAIAETPSPDLPDVMRARFAWDNLATLITDPEAYLKDLFGWGGEFQAERLLLALNRLVTRLGLETAYGHPPDFILEAYFLDAPPGPAFEQLSAYIQRGITGEVWTATGLQLSPIPAEDGDTPHGLVLAPVTQGALEYDVELSDNATLSVSSEIDAAPSAAIELLPGQPARIVGAAADIAQRIEVRFEPAPPAILIGDPGSVRLQIGGYLLSVEVRGTTAQPELILRAATLGDGLQVVIAPGQGDSFIRALLGEQEFIAGTDLDLEWSNLRGIAIAGGVQLDVTIPLNLKMLMLTILELHLSLGVGPSGAIEVQADVDASATLGPFTLTVANIGATATLTPLDDPKAAGAFGGLDVVWAFLPPDGIGAAFDFLGIVYGGGFIWHPEEGVYSGIITVEIAAIGVTATAVITTQLPGNPDAWSMFISINVDLGSIPIGFGFTLEKVGGLIGVNRAIDKNAFLAGVRTGLLDSVMFPDDPITNAPRILSDIETAFPTAEGSFVVGAMLQIGWGTPTIITADLGFIIQVPDIIIMLIGQAETILPFEDVALIEIHFDVTGIIDLTAGTLSIDAGLRDSHIAGYVLTGQMAMRASFLAGPSFLLSLGGYHPAFVAPEGFPALARLGVSLSLGGWLHIALEAYLALTSNTVQFGAGIYLTASLVGFRIEGGTEINTLIQFSPFQFRADLRYYITVSAASVELMGVLLTGELRGPNPYYVRGTARFKLLGLEKEVNIEETIGDKSPIDDVDDVPVLPGVVAAMESAENWRAIDDPARVGAALLASITDPAAPVAVHPGGFVEVVQRVAPLDVELERYGNAEIEGEDTLDVADVEAGGDGIAWEFVEDWFAPAEFFDLAEDEKLRSPSFEMMKAGVRLGDDEAEAGPRNDTVYDYQQIIRDPEFEVPTLVLDKTFRPQTANIHSYQAQVTTLSNRRRPVASRAVEQVYELKPTRYVIVERETLATANGLPTREMTFSEARQMARTGGMTGHIVVTSSERQMT